MPEEFNIRCINQLEFHDYGNASYNNQKLCKGWGSRVYFYYDKSSDRLLCRSFSVADRIKRHLYGEESKYNKKDLLSFLQDHHAIKSKNLSE